MSFWTSFRSSPANTATVIPKSSQAASNSASAWRAPSPRIRRSSSWTSPSAPWTPLPASASKTSSSTSSPSSTRRSSSSRTTSTRPSNSATGSSSSTSAAKSCSTTPPTRFWRIPRTNSSKTSSAQARACASSASRESALLSSRKPFAPARAKTRARSPSGSGTPACATRRFSTSKNVRWDGSRPSSFCARTG